MNGKFIFSDKYIAYYIPITPLIQKAYRRNVLTTLLQLYILKAPLCASNTILSKCFIFLFGINVVLDLGRNLINKINICSRVPINII